MAYEIEEGSPCPEPGCTGHMEFGEVEGCSCHIDAPCSACENNGLVCDMCGLDTAEDYKLERDRYREKMALENRDRRGKSWRDGGRDRTNETTFTRVSGPYNSTRFTQCCGVAALGGRCPYCNAEIVGHSDPEMDARRRWAKGGCLLCGKPLPSKSQSFGTPGTCIC